MLQALELWGFVGLDLGGCMGSGLIVEAIRKRSFPCIACKHLQTRCAKHEAAVSHHFLCMHCTSDTRLRQFQVVTISAPMGRGRFQC